MPEHLYASSSKYVQNEIFYANFAHRVFFCSFWYGNLTEPTYTFSLFVCQHETHLAEIGLQTFRLLLKTLAHKLCSQNSFSLKLLGYITKTLRNERGGGIFWHSAWNSVTRQRTRRFFRRLFRKWNSPPISIATCHREHFFLFSSLTLLLL